MTDEDRDNDLLRRGDVIAALKRMAEQHADLALYGCLENARPREAAEAALTRASCGIALMDPSEALTTAQAENEKLRAALEWYADQFCELGNSDGCHGELTDEECRGCRARALSPPPLSPEKP